MAIKGQQQIKIDRKFKFVLSIHKDLFLVFKKKKLPLTSVNGPEKNHSSRALAHYWKISKPAEALVLWLLSFPSAEADGN